MTKRVEVLEPFTFASGNIGLAWVTYEIGNGERRATSFRPSNSRGPILDEILGNVGVVREARIRKGYDSVTITVSVG